MSFRQVTARLILAVLTVSFVVAGLAGQALTQQATYVGSEVCGDCHDVEYENYIQYSKKSHSGTAVQTMAGDLSQEELHECYACHTTGYGEPGGFVSFKETPELGNAGCEVCHGPGSEHVDDYGNPLYIKGNLTIQDCEHCHNPERVAAFDYKPLIFGGAH